MNKNTGCRYIFWGIFFLFFNINLGAIKILPDFVAILILAKGIGIIIQEYSNKYLKLSKTIAYVYAAVSVAVLSIEFWVSPEKNTTIYNIVSILGLTIDSILHISTFFYLLYGLSIMLTKDGFCTDALKVRNASIGYIIIYTIGMCAGLFTMSFLRIEAIGIVSVIILLCSIIWILKTIADVRSKYNQENEESSNLEETNLENYDSED